MTDINIIIIENSSNLPKFFCINKNDIPAGFTQKNKTIENTINLILSLTFTNTFAQKYEVSSIIIILNILTTRCICHKDISSKIDVKIVAISPLEIKPKS
jgi:hypothetical protein